MKLIRKNKILKDKNIKTGDVLINGFNHAYILIYSKYYGTYNLISLDGEVQRREFDNIEELLVFYGITDYISKNKINLVED